jgi:hypothetical protein
MKKTNVAHDLDIPRHNKMGGSPNYDTSKSAPLPDQHYQDKQGSVNNDTTGLRRKGTTSEWGGKWVK